MLSAQDVKRARYIAILPEKILPLCDCVWKSNPNAVSDVTILITHDGIKKAENSNWKPVMKIPTSRLAEFEQVRRDLLDEYPLHKMIKPEDVRTGTENLHLGFCFWMDNLLAHREEAAATLLNMPVEELRYLIRPSESIKNDE